MTVENLEADLSAVSLAESPDDWAMAAYRLAVARAEAAGRSEDIDQALALLDKAARILTFERAPLEHGRILIAVANCHRARGRTRDALEQFARAAEMLASRAPVREYAGALINVGLALCEAGQPCEGVDTLNRAIEEILATRNDPDTEEFDEPEHGEVNRLLGAAFINRAQARQALGQDDDLESAVGDYEAAVDALPATSLQAGMAAHGLGATMLELCRRGSAVCNAHDAVGAFEQSLGVLSHTSFPFHHAVARHSLALAYETRNTSGDLARALNSAHAAIAVFDPRLHASHWHTAHATLTRLEAKLNDGSQSSSLDHVARLLAVTTEAERELLLRDRLLRAASMRPLGMAADLGALVDLLVDLKVDEYRRVLSSLIGVLMELPDQLLAAACEAICRAHDAHDSTKALNEALDGLINERLFGPQRVRVRDLLEANGWERP